MVGGRDFRGNRRPAARAQAHTGRRADPARNISLPRYATQLGSMINDHAHRDCHKDHGHDFGNRPIANQTGGDRCSNDCPPGNRSQRSHQSGSKPRDRLPLFIDTRMIHDLTLRGAHFDTAKLRALAKSAFRATEVRLSYAVRSAQNSRGASRSKAA